MMVPILLAIAGLVLGATLGAYGSWLYAGLAGLTLGLLLETRRRLHRLEQEVARLRVTPSAEKPAAKRTEKPPMEAEDPATETGQAQAAEAQPTPQASLADAWAEPDDWDLELPSHPASAIREKATAQWQRARDWLLGGNIMVRIGVVVLFFGVAFLLKFAAESSMLPIELRLAGVALGGILMLVLGWRLRESKKTYGLVLQGGAVGVLYLTVFAALRLYAVIPPGLAFGLLVLFAAFSAALAVLQNAKVLAMLGAAGGFLAPVLASTGEGSHVQLFSYYLVLNLAILGIGWFRSWRLLNLVGFCFTFVIASFWGYRFYQPHFFASTEPFLLAFVFLYVAIAILFAFRQPVQLRGYVDASLVFGVPLVGFAMQAGLVQGMDNYLAWSALAAAAFYIVLARLLFGHLGKDSRLLAEAFLAIGVVFATLTVPLALDARWTAGMWALEGAAMVWVGMRQGLLVPRLFGYLLQWGAGVAFFQAAQHLPYRLPPLNGIFLGALIIALAGLFTAWHIHRYAQAFGAPSLEGRLHGPYFLWGLLWWYGAWMFQLLDRVSPERNLVVALGLFFTASGVIADDLRRRLDWPALGYPARALLPTLYLVLLLAVLVLDRPFQAWAWVAWIAGLWGHLWVLRGEEDAERFVGLLHMAGVWLVMVLLSWETAWWLNETVQGADTWWRISWGLVPAGLSVLLVRFGPRMPWPVSAHPGLYLERALVPVGFYLWTWILVLILASRGASDPLPFVPLLNPMDIAVGLVALVLLNWLYPVRGEGPRVWRFAYASRLFALTLFTWINTAWFRTAHHWMQVDFDPHAMLGSQMVQAGLAVLWGLAGLSGMTLGARLGRRHLWFVGAGLMAAVVLKLFLVDLSNTGTMARIVSFLSVGLLLLVVGYFSPIPPRSEQESES
jgi:uncharacterized membrane protein